jgi:hypothetical protein
MKRRSLYAVVVIALACLAPTGDIQANSVPRYFGPPDKFAVASEQTILQIPSSFQSATRMTFSALSPDGRSVLSIWHGRLTIRPLESPEEKELLPPGSIATLGNESWAVWSADGKAIYYLLLTDRPGITDLWRLDLSTLKTKLLIKNAGGVSTARPQPSPDGKSIAFYRGSTLMLASADGQSEQVLWERPNRQDYWWGFILAWSPDSSQILVPTERRASKGLRDLDLVTVSTKQVRHLASWRHPILSIVWPSWGSGAFLCVMQPAPAFLSRRAVGQIWHLSVPQDERNQITDGSADYRSIFGGGAKPYSLVAQRLETRPEAWQIFREILTTLSMNPPVSSPAHTVMLTLRK